MQHCQVYNKLLYLHDNFTPCTSYIKSVQNIRPFGQFIDAADVKPESLSESLNQLLGLPSAHPHDCLPRNKERLPLG